LLLSKLHQFHSSAFDNFIVVSIKPTKNRWTESAGKYCQPLWHYFGLLWLLPLGELTVISLCWQKAKSKLLCARRNARTLAHIKAKNSWCRSLKWPVSIPARSVCDNIICSNTRCTASLASSRFLWKCTTDTTLGDVIFRQNQSFKLK